MFRFAAAVILAWAVAALFYPRATRAHADR